MRLPRSLARFNTKVTNPLQSLWAGELAPWIILEHTGRRSGRTYRTPMLAWRRGDRLLIGILYGEESSWVRNVLAAGLRSSDPDGATACATRTSRIPPGAASCPRSGGCTPACPVRHSSMFWCRRNRVVSMA
jgi:hypothetical protein